MGFNDDELIFLFSESKHVLKNEGILSFSVRSDKDIMYQKSTKVIENVYDIDCFHIRFFTKQNIKFFVNDMFKIRKISEEEPANLYFFLL